MLRLLFEKPWVNPNPELQKAMTGPVIVTSKKSQKVDKVTSSLNIFTIFTSDVANTLYRSKVLECVKDVYPGQDTHPAHALWHESDPDRSTHVHLAKHGFQPITPEELKCLFDNLKKADIKEGRCRDGQTRCYITDEDAQKILSDYEKYFHSSKEAQAEWVKHLKQADIELYNRIWDQAKSMLATFAHAFSSTFIQIYLRPYLLSRGYDAKKSELIAGGLQTFVTYLLTSSPWHLFGTTALRMTAGKFLATLGLEKYTANLLAIQFSSALGLAKDPFSLFRLFDSEMASSLGVLCAYKCIQNLPKLRQEPAADPVEEESVVQNSSNRLRRR